MSDQPDFKIDCELESPALSVPAAADLPVADNTTGAEPGDVDGQPAAARPQLQPWKGVIYALSIMLPVVFLLYTPGGGPLHINSSLPWSTSSLLKIFPIPHISNFGPISIDGLLEATLLYVLPSIGVSWVGWFTAAWLLRQKVHPLGAFICWVFLVVLVSVALGFASTAGPLP